MAGLGVGCKFRELVVLLKQVLKFVKHDEFMHIANQIEVSGVHFSINVLFIAVDLVLLCSVEQSIALKDPCDPEMRPIDYGELDKVLLVGIYFPQS